MISLTQLAMFAAASTLLIFTPGKYDIPVRTTAHDISCPVPPARLTGQLNKFFRI